MAHNNLSRHRLIAVWITIFVDIVCLFHRTNKIGLLSNLFEWKFEEQ